MKKRLVILALLAMAHGTVSVGQPITLHPANPHYFLWRGEPTVLVTSSEHYGAVINLDFDFEKYLARLHELGFNNTRIFAGDYVEKPGDFCIALNTLAPAPGRFIAPWARSSEPGFALGGAKFDLDRWDAAYFERLHEFMSLAQQYGIVVEVMLFFDGMTWDVQAPLNPKNNVNHTSAIKAKDYLTLNNGNILPRQEAYCRKMIRELNAYDNLIINISMEPWFNNQEHPGFSSPPSDRTKAWIERVSEWIVDEEKKLPQKHLISVDYANRGAIIKKDNLKTFWKNISVFNTHYDKYAESVKLNWDVPAAFAYNETGFLPIYHSEGYRVHGWRYLFSGGALYNNLDYTYQVGYEDGSRIAEFSCDHYVGCGNPDTKYQLAHLLKFFSSLPFIKMTPDRNVIAIGDFEADVYPLVWEGHDYAFYIDGGSHISLQLNMPPGRWRIEWIDAKTGKTVKERTAGPEHGLLQVESPPYHRDIALRIRLIENSRGEK